MKRNSTLCEGWINFAIGALWMTSVTAWFAAKLLPAGKSG